MRLFDLKKAFAILLLPAPPYAQFICSTPSFSHNGIPQPPLVSKKLSPSVNIFLG
jgi:hypothetical protein